MCLKENDSDDSDENKNQLIFFSHDEKYGFLLLISLYLIHIQKETTYNSSNSYIFLTECLCIKRVNLSSYFDTCSYVCVYIYIQCSDVMRKRLNIISRQITNTMLSIHRERAKGINTIVISVLLLFRYFNFFLVVNVTCWRECLNSRV
jgi:hypothetical protein